MRRLFCGVYVGDEEKRSVLLLHEIRLFPAFCLCKILFVCLSFCDVEKKNAVIDWMCVLYINRYIYLRSVGNLEYVRDVTLF